MKKIMLCLVLTLLMGSAIAQEQEVATIIKNSISVDKKAFMLPEYKGKNFVFTIGIGIDANGKIDTMLHSESLVFSNKLIGFKKIKSGIIKNEKKFAGYANQFLLLTINLMRGDEDPKSYPDLKDRAWMELMMKSNELQPGKKMITLEPILLVI
jgi:hypothetical protein